MENSRRPLGWREEMRDDLVVVGGKILPGIYGNVMATSNNGGHNNGNVSDWSPRKDKWSIKNEKCIFPIAFLSLHFVFVIFLSFFFLSFAMNFRFFKDSAEKLLKVIKDIVGIRVEKGLKVSSWNEHLR